MRDIIHAERLNELAFESQRFWDIRRWKEAPEHYQKNIYGFTVSGSTPEDYYVKTLLQEQNFGLKDYFWPIAKGDIEVNPIKGKKLTNMRAAGKDEAVALIPPVQMSLEAALSYIAEDELVEVTPKTIRLRKKLLDSNDRRKFERGRLPEAE